MYTYHFPAATYHTYRRRTRTRSKKGDRKRYAKIRSILHLSHIGGVSRTILNFFPCLLAATVVIYVRIDVTLFRRMYLYERDDRREKVISNKTIMFLRESRASNDFHSLGSYLFTWEVANCCCKFSSRVLKYAVVDYRSRIKGPSRN